MLTERRRQSHFSADPDLHSRVVKYCKSRRLKIGRFVAAVLEDAMARGLTVERRVTLELKKPC